MVLDAVVNALDPRAWWALRREMKRTVEETKAHMRFVVDAILLSSAAPSGASSQSRV